LINQGKISFEQHLTNNVLSKLLLQTSRTWKGYKVKARESHGANDQSEEEVLTATVENVLKDDDYDMLREVKNEMGWAKRHLSVAKNSRSEAATYLWRLPDGEGGGQRYGVVKTRYSEVFMKNTRGILGGKAGGEGSELEMFCRMALYRAYLKACGSDFEEAFREYVHVGVCELRRPFLHRRKVH
jgi:hypothetical protein